MTQEEANKLILEHCTKEGIAQGWVEEHIKYNAIKEENEELQARIDKAIEYIEEAQESDGDDEACSLHIPTLKAILKGSDKE